MDEQVEQAEIIEQINSTIISISDIELKEIVKEIEDYHKTRFYGYTIKKYTNKICDMSQGVFNSCDYSFIIMLLLKEVARRWSSEK